MLNTSDTIELYKPCFERILDEQTKDAFRYFLGVSALSGRFRCFLRPKGVIWSFRFEDIASGEEPHSFIPNQHWLLFYFRPPAVRSGVYAKDRLAEDFDSFNETKAGEWTVRLRNISDVQRLIAHIRW